METLTLWAQPEQQSAALAALMSCTAPGLPSRLAPAIHRADRPAPDLVEAFQAGGQVDAISERRVADPVRRAEVAHPHLIPMKPEACPEAREPVPIG